jgi:hypothetical protein
VWAGLILFWLELVKLWQYWFPLFVPAHTTIIRIIQLIHTSVWCEAYHVMMGSAVSIQLLWDLCSHIFLSLHRKVCQAVAELFAVLTGAVGKFGRKVSSL